MTRLLRRGLWVATLLSLFTAPAIAHDPGLSGLNVTITRDSVVAVLSMSKADAQAAGNLGTFALTAIHVLVDGRELPGVVTTIEPEGGDAVRVRLAYTRPAGSRLLVRSEVPRRIVRGHRQLVSLRNQGGSLLAERMLDGSADDVTVDVDVSEGDEGTTLWLWALSVVTAIGILGRLIERRTYALCLSTRQRVSASDSPSHGSGT